MLNTIKMNKTDLFLKVDRILWEEWDPIGLNGNGGPADEYRGYVPSIIKLLQEETNVSKIAKLLYEHANVNMGLSSTLRDHLEIATKLKNLIE